MLSKPCITRPELLAALERAIPEAGRVPVQRNTYYEPLRPSPDLTPLPDMPERMKTLV